MSCFVKKLHITELVSHLNLEMCSTNCSSLLFAFLLSAPLLPHICCLDLAFFLPSNRYPRRLIQKRDISAVILTIISYSKFKKEEQPSSLRWGFPQFQRRFSRLAEFPLCRCHCKVLLAWESINSFFKKKEGWKSFWWTEVTVPVH